MNFSLVFSAFLNGLAFIFIIGGTQTIAFAQDRTLTRNKTYTQAQFERGEDLYKHHCESCHGRALEGGSASALLGYEFRQSWHRPNVSTDDLFYIIRTNMPPDQPEILGEQDYLNILAFILGNNGVLVGEDSLHAGSAYLAEIIMPEHNEGDAVGFIRGESGIQPTGIGPSAQALKQAETDSDNWLYHTHNYAGTRFSPLAQIDRNNVKSLQTVCLSQLGGESDFQAGPIVFNGVMYLTTGASTVAIDARTCHQIWRYQWQYQDVAIESTNRGVAIQDGYVVRGTADGYLLALDALNGELLWARQIANPAEGEHFTMPPMIYEKSIFIGPAGGDYGISGWIGAFSLVDGEPLWKFHTVPGARDDESDSWSNPLGIKIGGGAVWTPLSLDVETESLYVAVTNPAPAFPADLRPGDNLYTNSVLSLAVNTGELNWYQQLLSADDHGWDLTQVSPLYKGQIDGVVRNLITTVGKDGLLRVLDRDSQAHVFETAVTTQQNVDATVTVRGTYTCPGVLGGVLWNGPAYDPLENLLITPAVNLCSTFYRARETRYIEGRNYFGGTVVSDASTLSGWLTAVNGQTGDVVWQYTSDLPMVAGVTTTAGGLVLTGELGGDFMILDSANGEELFRFHTGGAVGGGVISYQVEGKQYIAVASGQPSVSQVNGRTGSPTMVIFALPER